MEDPSSHGVMSQGGTAEGLESLDERLGQLTRIVELFVDKGEADFGVRLDYTVGSIRYVDTFLSQARDRRHDLSPGLYLSIGGYVGEVFVRCYDGEWIENGDSLAVRVPGPVHDETLPVFDWVKAAYRNPAESLTQRLDRVMGDGLGDSTLGVA